jgi:hypothetical protein
VRQNDRLPRFHSLAVAEARRNLSLAMFTGMALTAKGLRDIAAPCVISVRIFRLSCNIVASNNNPVRNAASSFSE